MLSSYLVSKLPTYLIRLQLTYQNTGERRLSEIILSSRYTAVERTAHDNWNGGMDGHDLILFLPLATLSLIELDELDDVRKRILDDLGKLAQGIDNEWWNALRLELNDENDPDYQRAIPFSSKLPVNPDAVDFWKPGLARVFISHRDLHKREARDLSDALEEYGFSCFVAHDTIRPLSEWRDEIMRGLETMEVMLVFLTDNFEESLWCQQEVGFALGKGTPIISLKLQHKDPPGFISHVQALRGSADKPLQSAQGLFPLIGKALGRQERLNEILITALVESPSYADTKTRFDRLVANVKTLTEQQANRLIEGFRSNGQLFSAGHLTSKYERFRNYLESATGKTFVREKRDIKEVRKQAGFAGDIEDTPF